MTVATATAPEAKPRSVFAVRDFRLLWLGEAISALGDQFALIALPWLALLLTGSALALGTVLAVMAIPRAVLMLIGGAYVDRLSPRRVMQVSNAVRFIAVGALALIVLAGNIELWMLYIFALVFGVADAFFYPAQTAITPELVDGDQLQQANGITQGTTQLTVLIGPAVAGIIIAALEVSGAQPGLAGIGIALLIDALTFAASLLTLALIRRRSTARAHEKSSVITDIVEGIRFVARAPALRVVMLVSMGLNLLIVGPIEVGLPFLAYARLPEGAVAFGLILSAFGGGSLLGLTAATVLPAPPPARLGVLLFLLVATSGLGVAAIAFTTSTAVLLGIAVVVGAILGYTNVSFITWTQRRVPRLLMGRVMSLLIFMSVALVPISIAVAGAFVQLSFEAVMITAGLGMSLVTLLGLLSRSVRQMEFEPVIEEADEEATDAYAATAPSEPALAA